MNSEPLLNFTLYCFKFNNKVQEKHQMTLFICGNEPQF